MEKELLGKLLSFMSGIPVAGTLLWHLGSLDASSLLAWFRVAIWTKIPNPRIYNIYILEVSG